MMKMLKFRVTNFRSVKDSGWIDTDGVTAFIGTNESGKANLLTPLWKLKPAERGEISPIPDYPRKQYNDFREMKAKPVFIQAQFEMDTLFINRLTALTGATTNEVRVAEVSHSLDGRYIVAFPNEAPIRSSSKKAIGHTYRR